MQVQNSGVNSTSIDMLNCTPGPLNINHNPRNGLPYFNTSLFTPNALGTQGNARRRMFYGPGIDNCDMALRKLTTLGEHKSLEADLWGLMQVSQGLLGFSETDPPKISRLNRQSQRIAENNNSVL